MYKDSRQLQTIVEHSNSRNALVSIYESMRWYKKRGTLADLLKKNV